MKEIVRKLLAEYYGISTTSGSTTTVVNHLMNTGFTKLDEESNPQTEKVAYVGDSNSTVTVTGYENGWTFEARYIKGDPVIDDIVEIARKQKVGEECARSIISVDLDDLATEGVYRARKANVTVEVTAPKGEPKSVTKVSGTFHQNGDFVYGTFTLADKSFTADE